MTTFNGEQPNQIQALIAGNAKAIASNTNAISELRAGLAETKASIDGLVQTIAEYSIRTEARLNILDENVTAIRETNEKLEQLINYLVRQKGSP